MPHATLRDLKLRSQYRTNPLDHGSVVGDFYIPVLEVARKYDRLAGFFSSASLALAAKGIAALIATGGHMRLICSPNLSAADLEVLRSASSSGGAERIAKEYWGRFFLPNEDQIQKDHLAALGWMLDHGFLDIKFAVVRNGIEGTAQNVLCHPKVGIVEDRAGNRLSFSGSNNETVGGWAANQEEFKVFQEWMPGQEGYYRTDRDYFESYWSDTCPGVMCLDLPEAFRSGLVNASREFDREAFLARHYTREVKRTRVWHDLSLRDYQVDAVGKWIDNGYALLFEMATGTGKTRTAIACLNKVMERERSGIVVVAAPRVALCDQWRREMSGRLIEDVVTLTANSDNSDWRKTLDRIVAGLRLGTRLSKWVVVFTSHVTAASKDFVSLVRRCPDRTCRILIADETHALGAADLRKALLDSFRYRIGLSATPERLFDEAGSKLIRDYFGGASFVFGLGDAIIHQCVSSYRYYPIVTPLSVDERLAYDQLTERITKLGQIIRNEYDPEAQARLEKALRDRAHIVEAAESKIPALRKLLGSEEGLFEKNVIAFTCSRNIEDVIRVFADEMKIVRRFTYLESDRQVREEILRQFGEGGCAALVAMKCLDEGIDIPSASVAILVSSTTNPREYIQRIGRVLRKSPEKQFARVYDFIVSLDAGGSLLLERDLKRAFYVAEFAENASEVLDVLYGKDGVAT